MKYIFLIISAFIFVNAQAQQSDATYLKIHKTYVINEDGSYDYTYTHQLKYHSYISFHRKYGETFVIYDPDYQSVKVQECKTTMRDGKVVKAPDNAFNEVLPRYAEHSGAYNHLRELVITHTGLEQEALVDLTYTIHSDTMPAGFLSGKESLVYSSPVKELKLTFKVPANVELSFEGNKGQKVFNENGDQKVYTFIYNELPANIKFTRAGGEAASVLYFNQGKKLETQLISLMNSELKPDNYDKTFGPVVKENMDEVMRIQRKMVKEMRTIHVPLTFQKLPVPSIKAIQLNNSGTVIEKALLLRKKLWDIKIDANLAFEFPVEQFNEKVSNLENVTNVYVVVPTTSDPILLPVDDIPAANPLFTNYDKVIVALSPDGELQKLVPQNMNYAKLDMFIKVGKDYSEVSYQGIANGIFAGWPGANFETPRRMTNYTKEIEDDIVIESSASIKMNGRFESEHNQYDNLLEVKLPILNAGFNQFIHDQLPKGQPYVVEYGFPLEETYVYSVDNNNDCELIRTPDDFNVKNDFFEIVIRTEKGEKETIITQSVKIKSPVIPAEHYKQLRESMINLGKNTGRTLLFRCNEK
ncbi:MAG: hypothetical protein C0599_06100 [Salinivirgaceae bacterium]|nr:MAG: hypothetical protein C0599_06100 [Salinivirgaceae bacterium]